MSSLATISGDAERYHSVDLGDARVHCLDVGAGRPMLMLHGYPQSSACWRHQIRALEGERRIIAPDLPGWGRSAGDPELDHRYPVEVERLARLLDAREVRDPIDLVAHDYGGFIGLGFVLRYPARVRSLVLFNSRAHRTFPGIFYLVCWVIERLCRTAVGRALFASFPLAFVHRMGLRTHARRGCFDEARIEAYVAPMRGRNGRRWLARLFSQYPLAARPELREGLATIACLTTVVWGDRDPWCPFSTAEELAANIPNATLVRLSGVDHFVMEEEPERVTAALRAHLRRVEEP